MLGVYDEIKYSLKADSVKEDPRKFVLTRVPLWTILGIVTGGKCTPFLRDEKILNQDSRIYWEFKSVALSLKLDKQPRYVRNIGIFLLLLILSATTVAEAGERDIRIPRVPPDHLEEAKAVGNPLLASDSNRLEGKRLFTSACTACHGPEGKGDGPVAKESAMDPSPRNFSNPEFQRIRTDGELFWVLKHGSHNTEMMRMDYFFTDEELWKLILYIRTLGAPAP